MALDDSIPSNVATEIATLYDQRATTISGTVELILPCEAIRGQKLAGTKFSLLQSEPDRRLKKEGPSISFTGQALIFSLFVNISYPYKYLQYAQN